MNSRVLGVLMLPLLVCMVTLGCRTEGGGGGNPVQPQAQPTIASIQPSDAAPGDSVTIRGSNFEFGVTVSFDGVPGQVVSAGDSLAVVVLPNLPPGDHSVVIGVGSSSSQPFRYRIAPAKAPLIAAIQPAKAHVGERIVITGMHFRQTSAPVVRVAGVGAILGSATASRIVAFVPVLEPGMTSVVVASGSLASAEYPLEILHSPPAIVSVVPNPTRAGLWITIRGAYLAGTEVAVLIDGEQADIGGSGEMTELSARIPDVTVGEHVLRVKVDGDLSEPFALDVDNFSATGTYQVHGVVVRTLALLPGCHLPEVGTKRDVLVELRDNRPELVARITSDLRQYSGTIDSEGHISPASTPSLFPIAGSSIRGSVRHASDGRLGIDVTVTRPVPDFCSVEERLTGTRVP